MFLLNLCNQYSCILSTDSSSSMRFTSHRNIKVSNQSQECEKGDRTLPWHRHLPCGRTGEGWHYRVLWVLSLGKNELLPLGYQASPMTPWWSRRAVLLFHYHRGSRSMERRHHYPSGLMRLSHCPKRSGNYCGCSFQPGDAKRVEKDGCKIDSSTHWNTETCAHMVATFGKK